MLRIDHAIPFVDRSIAACLVDRTGIIARQSRASRRLVGFDAREVLARYDPGRLSVRILDWCLELGEPHVAVFAGRTLRMQPLANGALVTLERPVALSARAPACPVPTR